MAELNFTKLADAPILESVPDGAKVYAEVEGKVYRVAGDNLGGGVKAATYCIPEDSAPGGKYYTTCQNMTYDEAKATLLAKKPIIMMRYSQGSMYCDVVLTIKIDVDVDRITLFITADDCDYWHPDGTITSDGSYTPNLS